MVPTNAVHPAAAPAVPTAVTNSVPPAPPTGPAALLYPKSVAERYVRNLIDKGVAIRRLRVRYVDDLEDVRGKKAEWVAQYTEVLRQLFTTSDIADACNDWVGRVYPEYADATLFVEQFYQEMDHRCRRLRGVLKQIGEMGDPVIPVKSGAAAEGAEGSAGGAPGAQLLPETAATALHSPSAAAAEPPSPPGPVRGLLVAPEGDARAADVATFLSDLGLTTTALPSAGSTRSSPEAYEASPDAAFAVMLLGADDLAAPRPATDGGGAAAATRRADTPFLLGYLVGRFGAKNVCLLAPGAAAAEPFTDSHGVACLPLDAARGWQLQLARHLRRAGVDVDLNRLC
jgi:hypothetical protein